MQPRVVLGNRYAFNMKCLFYIEQTEQKTPPIIALSAYISNHTDNCHTKYIAVVQHIITNQALLDWSATSNFMILLLF
jgi:hypothetical protein